MHLHNRHVEVPPEKGNFPKIRFRHAMESTETYVGEG
jgi:hypothetical protein